MKICNNRSGGPTLASEVMVYRVIGESNKISTRTPPAPTLPPVELVLVASVISLVQSYINFYIQTHLRPMIFLKAAPMVMGSLMELSA